MSCLNNLGSLKERSIRKYGKGCYMSLVWRNTNQNAFGRQRVASWVEQSVHINTATTVASLKSESCSSLSSSLQGGQRDVVLRFSPSGELRLYTQPIVPFQLIRSVQHQYGTYQNSHRAALNLRAGPRPHHNFMDLAERTEWATKGPTTFKQKKKKFK